MTEYQLAMEGCVPRAVSSLRLIMLGETSVLNEMILVISARLFNIRACPHARDAYEKRTRLPPQSVLWTHRAVLIILVLFFLGASLKIEKSLSCPNNRFFSLSYRKSLLEWRGFGLSQDMLEHMIGRSTP